MLPIVKGLLTGAAFGFVLYKVGAVRYSRVMGMLTLRDAKIMKFAFTAIATASLWYGLAAVAGVAEGWNLVPRTMPFLGMAHVVGGTLFGIGMGVSGLCPGTCVAKAGGRGGEQRFTTLGAVLGLFTGVLLYDALKDGMTSAGIIATHQKPLTLHGVVGLPYGVAALLAAAGFMLLSVTIDRVLPEKHYTPARARTVMDTIRGEWSWLAGGVVGGTIIVLATVQGGYLGFSGAILALTGAIAQLIGHPLSSVPAMSDDLLWRAALIVGAFPGALLASLISVKSAAAASSVKVAKMFDGRAIATSFGAGTVMCFGAMVGGGCTTGAFISAWPTLSLGSFAMGGTFFAVSMLTSQLRALAFHSLDLPAAQLSGDRVYD